MKNDSPYYLAAAVLCASLLAAPEKMQAARNHHLNMNIEGNAERCSELKVRSDGEVAQAVESYTLQKREAPSLEMSAFGRGILRVRGWDRAEYSIEACKIAVAENRAGAEQALRGISVSRNAGHISASGPAGDDTTWEVYFIVHAPKDANLELETKNGPIDVADVTGTMHLRAVNGPVSLNNCLGTIEVHTVNGPISFAGTGGEVHLNAQNGPISLNLKGDVWNGPRLDARTVNGPVTLYVAETFRSGVRVESSGHSPISCGAGACGSAWSNSNSHPRAIQLNGSQDTIRVSTTNGPVSINGSPKSRRII